MDIHKNLDRNGTITAQSSKFFRADGVEIIDNRVVLHISGAEYPLQAYAPTEDIFSYDIIKRFLMKFIKLSYLLNPIFLIRPKKLLNKLVFEYVELAHKVIIPHLWKEELLHPVAKEMWYLTEYILKDLGVEKSREMAELVANMINIDDAYRLRIMDVFHETNSLDMRKAIKVYKSRENGGMIKKMTPILWMIYILSYTKSFKRALNVVYLNNIQPNTADLYWMNVKQDANYKFFGKEHKERMQDINHLKVPKPTTL